MKVHIARLSFISPSQKKLFKPKFEGTPIELAEKLLVDNPRYSPKKKRGFVGLILGGFRFGTDGRLLSAKLGKAKEVKLPDYDKDKIDFLDKKGTLYPHVYLFWDREEQVILIERDTSVFWNYETVLKSIEDYLNTLLAEYELRVFVEPLTEKTDFWKAIRTYKYLYGVNFELHMPNFFGKTQQAIREILEMHKDRYNATGVLTQISNPDGGLEIPEDDPQINTNLEWITKGGGSWSIRGKKAEGKKKVKITSTRSQNIKVEETIEIENYTAEEVVSILSVVRPKYSVKSTLTEEYSVKSTQGEDDENK
jgi:hypothetical protein